MDVRRVVPGIRHEVRYRHAAFGRQVPAAAPVAEVGEGDDALTAHSQHFVEDAVGVFHGLQGLGHDHHVEAVAGEVAQAFVQVLFDDVDALGQAGGDIVGVDFQAIAGDLFAVTQRGQQFAATAAQVEYPAAGGDPVVDDFQIGSHAVLRWQCGSCSSRNPACSEVWGSGRHRARRANRSPGNRRSCAQPSVRRRSRANGPERSASRW